MEKTGRKSPRRGVFFVPEGEFVSLLFSLPTFPHRGTKKKVSPSAFARVSSFGFFLPEEENKRKKREEKVVVSSFVFFSSEGRNIGKRKSPPKVE